MCGQMRHCGTAEAADARLQSPLLEAATAVTKLRPSASAAPPSLKLRRSPVDQKSLVVAHLVERRPACLVQTPGHVFPRMERSLA
jgi:hypothetical protein